MKRKQKTERKTRCSSCGHPGFWKSRAFDGRPRFTCDFCGHEWTNGKDGGEYNGKEMGTK